jgi:DNA-binding Xre family transcriptional regulator
MVEHGWGLSMVGTNYRRRKSKAKKDNFVREWREFRGFRSQGDLGRACGITRATISRLESGRLQYRQWHLDKIAKILDCRPGDLISYNPYTTDVIIGFYHEMSQRRRAKVDRFIRELLNEEPRPRRAGK